MLELKCGEVSSFRPISKRTVQIHLKDDNTAIELTTYEPWVLVQGDKIAVSGEFDRKSGKFIAYAYNNVSKSVVGKYEVPVGGGIFALFIGSAMLSGGQGGLIAIALIILIIGIIATIRGFSKRMRCSRARKLVMNAQC